KEIFGACSSLRPPFHWPRQQNRADHPLADSAGQTLPHVETPNIGGTLQCMNATHASIFVPFVKVCLYIKTLLVQGKGFGVLTLSDSGLRQLFLKTRRSPCRQ